MTQLTLVIGNKNYSSWSLRPWLAMKQAGLKFTEIRIPLDTMTTQAEILRYSPSGRVPVLLDGDLTVWESLAICEYVTEQFAPLLLPQDSTKRAIARSISCEMHSGFQSLRQNLPMNCRARFPRMGNNPSVQADINRVLSIWRNCRQTYGNQGAFLLGEFSIADAMYAPVVSRFVTYEVELDPVTQAYVETIWNLPAMQEWLVAASAETEEIAHP